MACQEVDDFAFVILDGDTFDQSGDDGAVASLAVAEFPAFLQGSWSGMSDNSAAITWAARIRPTEPSAMALNSLGY